MVMAQSLLVGAWMAVRVRGSVYELSSCAAACWPKRTIKENRGIHRCFGIQGIWYVIDLKVAKLCILTKPYQRRLTSNVPPSLLLSAVRAVLVCAVDTRAKRSYTRGT